MPTIAQPTTDRAALLEQLIKGYKASRDLLEQRLQLLELRVQLLEESTGPSASNEHRPTPAPLTTSQISNP